MVFLINRIITILIFLLINFDLKSEPKNVLKLSCEYDPNLIRKKQKNVGFLKSTDLDSTQICRMFGCKDTVEVNRYNSLSDNSMEYRLRNSWFNHQGILLEDYIEENGIIVDIVSIGGSPNMWEVEKIPAGTEYRIGTYIYNDRSLMERKVCREEDCALTVLATVVSTPTPQRAVIDAGSKVLTTDLFGLEGHGHIIDHEHLTISQLSEEHACIVSDGPTGLSIGQKVRIIPNHACVVSNMVDEVVFIDGGKVLKSQSVVARGKVL